MCAGSLSSSKAGGASVLERIFKKYDRDGSGSISADEFKKMAYDMGFGHMANEAFAVLDADRSGYITYKEVIGALKSNVPNNMDTKKLLFGCIWSWGIEEVDGGKNRSSKVDTSRWRIRSSETREVYIELRKLLSECGSHVSDMASLFDEDAGSVVLIDEVEFTKTLKSWGFRGMPNVPEDVFELINTSHSGKINFDEFFEYVRGHRHALDARKRNALVRELVAEAPPDADFALMDMLWDVEPSSFEAVESLRLLMQTMLLGSSFSPGDLLRAWDQSGDKLLDKREFVSNVRWLFRKEPQLWQRELHRVAGAAFTIIQDDGSDIDSTAMDVIEFEQWLERPTRRRPNALFPLKPHRTKKDKVVEAHVELKPAVRPGCDILSRAEKAIGEAKKVAAEKSMRAAALAEEHLRLYETRGSHQSKEQLRQSGISYPRVPWVDAPIVRKEWQPSHISQPNRSPRSRGTEAPGTAQPSGAPLPRLSPTRSPRGRTSPKAKRGGGVRRETGPWIDEVSGKLHLPPDYRDFASLTPRQMGALTGRGWVVMASPPRTSSV
jgi:Ca2+-binding EF-hand superfamily protein